MVTGRLGYAFDRLMIYVKGGVAFVPVRSSVVDQCATVATGCGNWLISTAVSDTVTTGTIGGGVERPARDGGPAGEEGRSAAPEKIRAGYVMVVVSYLSLWNAAPAYLVRDNGIQLDCPALV